MPQHKQSQPNTLFRSYRRRNFRFRRQPLPRLFFAKGRSVTTVDWHLAQRIALYPKKGGDFRRPPTGLIADRTVAEIVTIR